MAIWISRTLVLPAGSVDRMRCRREVHLRGWLYIEVHSGCRYEKSIRYFHHRFPCCAFQCHESSEITFASKTGPY